MSPEDKLDNQDKVEDASAPAEEVAEDQVEVASVPAEEVAEDQVEETGVPAEESKKKWYVVHTYSGFENNVKIGVEERFKDSNLEFKLGEIVVPNEQVVEVKNKGQRISNRKLFPGYVLIEMECDEETWYLVKNTPKVTGFLGGNNPSSISNSEVDKIIKQTKGEVEKPKPKFDFQKGESVRVIEGPFINFTGTIDEVHPDRGKLKVMVSIFGRTTPVELEILQVEKG